MRLGLGLGVGLGLGLGLELVLGSKLLTPLTRCIDASSRAALRRAAPA